VIIFGFRTSVTQLAMLSMVCAVCGNQSGQALTKRTTKFSLFFIPLFPVRTRYALQCSFCGASRRLDKNEALRLAA
jgi:hypothetical protein